MSLIIFLTDRQKRDYEVGFYIILNLIINYWENVYDVDDSDSALQKSKALSES